MTRVHLQALSLFVVALAGFVLGGCASSVELPPQATRDLLEMRDRAVAAKARIQTTNNAVRDLIQKPTQVDPLVGRLVNEIAVLRTMATEGQENLRSSDDRTSAYMAKWDEDIKTMSQSTREAGERRHAQAQASYDRLRGLIGEFRAEFRPYMADLDEVSRYLNTDGTAAGVAVVKRKMTDAVARENALMKKLDAAIAQIDAMRGGK